MTAEQWARVNALFHQVLERPPSEHVQFLRDATDDVEVRDEVAALVAAHASDPVFLEAPAVVERRPADQEPSGAGGETVGATARARGTAGSAPGLIGRTIGPYRVTRELGRGGMGVVYLAHDLRLGRDVAVKALPQEMAADPSRRERLRREARAAAALSHQGIATIFALEEDGDDLFLVSEYIPGRPLRDLIDDGPLPLDRLLRVSAQLADATAAAHAHGIVHRDLKPENVIYGETGSIKILDFGLARAIEPALRARAPTLTADGTLVGTPAYMSPEQMRGGVVDQRTDVFSLGVVLYELATGRHPFGSGPIGELIHQMLSGQPRPFDRPELPAAFTAVVLRCLESDPERRYFGAAEVSAALASIPGTSGVDVRGGAAVVSASTASRQPASAAGAGGTGPPPPTPARISGTGAWWWAFHQAAVALFFAALVAPGWMALALVEDARLRTLLRVALLVVVAAGVSVRLHLRFVARVHAESLAGQRARARGWLLTCDWGFVAVATAGALAVMDGHALVGGVVIGLAVCYAVVFLQVEPATARAAFGDE